MVNGTQKPSRENRLVQSFSDRSGGSGQSESGVREVGRYGHILKVEASCLVTGLNVDSEKERTYKRSP